MAFVGEDRAGELHSLEELRQIAENATGSPVIRVVEHESSYGSSRKAYVAETSTYKVFLRCAVPGLGLEGTLFSLAREANILEALASAGVPVPRPLGMSADGTVACLEWVDGETGPLGSRPTREQQSRQYALRISALRDVNAAAIIADDHPSARTIAEAVELDLQRWRDIATPSFLADPLGAWLLDWLWSHRSVDDRSSVVVHGDAGHGNFLVQNDSVSSLIDWELSHLGDPIEDIACVQMRSLGRDAAVWSDALIDLVNNNAGDYEVRLRWERVHVLVRSAIAMRRSLERGNRGRDTAPFARFEVENLLLSLREISVLTSRSLIDASPDLVGLIREAQRRCSASGRASRRVTDAATAFAMHAGAR